MSHVNESCHVRVRHVTQFVPCHWYLRHVFFFQNSQKVGSILNWATHGSKQRSLLSITLRILKNESQSHWRECILFYYTLIERTFPPPGGGSYQPCSLIKNPEGEDPPRSIWYKLFDGGPFPPGCWSGNMVNRKPPGGGGGSFDNFAFFLLHFALSKTSCLIRKISSLLQKMSSLSHFSRMSSVSPKMRSLLHFSKMSSVLPKMSSLLQKIAPKSGLYCKKWALNNELNSTFRNEACSSGDRHSK